MSRKEFQIFDALRVLPKCYHNQLKEVSCVVSNLKPIAEPSNFVVNLTSLATSESKNLLSSVSGLIWYEADISYVKINMLVNAHNSVCSSPYISKDCRPMLCIGKVQFPLFKTDTEVISKFSQLCISGSMKLVSLDGVYYLQMFKWVKQSDEFKVTKVIYGKAPPEDAALSFLLKQNRNTQNALLESKYRSRNIGISGVASSQTGNFSDFTYIDPRTVVLSDKLVVSDTDVAEIQSKTELNLSMCGMDFENSLNGRVGLRLVSWLDNHKGLIQHVTNIFKDFQKYVFDVPYSSDKCKEQAEYSQHYKLNFNNSVIDTVRAAKDNPYFLVFFQDIGVPDADYLYSQLFGKNPMHEEILELRRKARLHRYLMKNGSLTKADLDIYYSELPTTPVMHGITIDAKRKLSADVETYALKVQTEPGKEVYVDSYGIYLVQKVLSKLNRCKRTLSLSKDKYFQIVTTFITEILGQELNEENRVQYEQLYEAIAEQPSYIRTAYPWKMLFERFLNHLKFQLNQNDSKLHLCDLGLFSGVSGLKKLENWLSNVRDNDTVIFYGEVSDGLILKILKQSLKEYSYTVNISDSILRGLIKYTETWDDTYYHIPVCEATGATGVIKAINDNRTYVLNEYDSEPEVVVVGGQKTLIQGLHNQIQQMRLPLAQTGNLSCLSFKKVPEVFYAGETVELTLNAGKLKANERVEILRIDRECDKAKVTLKSETGDSVLITLATDQRGVCTSTAVFRHIYIRDYELDKKNQTVVNYANDIILVCFGKSVYEVLPLLCSGRRVHIIGKDQDLKKRVRRSKAAENPLRPLF